MDCGFAEGAPTDYSAAVLQRFREPYGAGELAESASGRLAAGEASDRTLNVWVRFQVQVLDGTIRSARFRAYGCPHTVAGASWAAASLEGRPVECLTELQVHELRAATGAPVGKLGKLLLLEDALCACARALAGDIEQKGR